MAKEKQIGTIRNHAGNLLVKQHNGKFFWGLNNYGGIWWEEIPKSLYDELVKFEESRRLAV